VSVQLVLHGGPTTGKTSLQKELLRRGYLTLDTDAFIDAFAPWWFATEAWKMDEPNYNKLWADIKPGLQIVSRPALLLTNMWGGFSRMTGLSPDLSFMRSPEQHIALATERGDSAVPTLDQATEWYEDALKRIPQMHHIEVHTLGENQFLSDFADQIVDIAEKKGITQTEWS
jgi:hypothetical protein